jgi:hypothetical protein
MTEADPTVFVVDAMAQAHLHAQSFQPSLGRRREAICERAEHARRPVDQDDAGRERIDPPEVRA